MLARWTAAMFRQWQRVVQQVAVQESVRTASTLGQLCQTGLCDSQWWKSRFPACSNASQCVLAPGVYQCYVAAGLMACVWQYSRLLDTTFRVCGCLLIVQYLCKRRQALEHQVSLQVEAQLLLQLSVSGLCVWVKCSASVLFMLNASRCAALLLGKMQQHASL